MYEIRDDLSPNDVRQNRPGPAPKYPFAQLDIGQHFVVPRRKAHSADDDRKRLHAAVARFRKHHPERAFKVTHDAFDGVFRVFRIAPEQVA